MIDFSSVSSALIASSLTFCFCLPTSAQASHFASYSAYNCVSKSNQSKIDYSDSEGMVMNNDSSNLTVICPINIESNSSASGRIGVRVKLFKILDNQNITCALKAYNLGDTLSKGTDTKTTDGRRGGKTLNLEVNNVTVDDRVFLECVIPPKTGRVGPAIYGYKTTFGS